MAFPRSMHAAAARACRAHAAAGQVQAMPSHAAAAAPCGPTQVMQLFLKIDADAGGTVDWCGRGGEGTWRSLHGYSSGGGGGGSVAWGALFRGPGLRGAPAPTSSAPPPPCPLTCPRHHSLAGTSSPTSCSWRRRSRRGARPRRRTGSCSRRRARLGLGIGFCSTARSWELLPAGSPSPPLLARADAPAQYRRHKSFNPPAGVT
jgi:hypothetical protein